MFMPSFTSALLGAGEVATDPAMVSSGEATLFFIMAPLIVLAALGLIFAKNAVHVALCMAFIMIGLAMFYAVQGAQFLFATQIVVYTGAIMMLFLFVLMLVGVDKDETLKETIAGNRLWSIVAAVGIGVVLVATIIGFLDGRFFGFETLVPIEPRGVEEANKDGNPQGVAALVFSPYVIALELVGTMLVSTAVGAIMLTHREKFTPSKTQRILSSERVKAGKFVAGLPAPGVFARHNSVDTPALLPDGTPAQASVSRVLRARGQVNSAEGLEEPMESKARQLHLDQGKDA